MKTLVIQSCREPAAAWLRACMQSVRQWAQRHGFEYRFIGDDIFSVVPDWYLAKTENKKQVATDFARLVLLHGALEKEGFDQAIWLDADVLVLDASMTLDFETTCAFGQESWIQADSEGRLACRKNVHNAVCAFRQHCPVLPFLIHTVESLVSRVEKDFIVPQFVGPKLLNALHPLAGFDLFPQAGALSEAVVADLLDHTWQGRALELLATKSAVTLQAVNLCASLLTGERASRLVEVLQQRPGLLARGS